jgi:hypothetical protein
MRLTRNWSTLKTGILTLGFGGLMFAAPTLLALIDYEFRLGPWIAWTLGGLGVLGGLYMTIEGARRYTIEVSETGLDLVVSGLTAKIAWDDVDGIVIEHDRSDGKQPPAILAMVPAEKATLPKQPTYDSHLDGRKGFILMKVDEIAQGHDGVVAAMTAHAGAKFSDHIRNPAVASS